MAELKLTVLIENSTHDGLTPEHGLSIHLDYRGHSVLLDGGASGQFARNAQALGIDLTAVEQAVLSHGHFDHSDGLAEFFRVNPHASVMARPAAMDGDYFSVGPIKKYIGVSRQLLDTCGQRFDLADGPREFLPGLWTVPDSVAHEHSLVAQTETGLVILNSCCHAGADKVVESVLAHFPGTPVRALIGGFHLMGLLGVKTMGPTPEEILALGNRLFFALGVEQVWTGHCTGSPAFELLHSVFPDRVQALSTGLVLEF